MLNITGVVKNELNMTTLNSGVVASGLNEFFDGPGPFTVFAPSNLAFGKLESGIMENLLKPENKKELVNLLKQHAVHGKINFKDLKDGEKLKSLNDTELMVQVKNNKITIDGATIQNRDVEALNGVIHSLDAVLKN